jgi:hypothetical protein
MFCPKCRSEFREGITYCNQCETELVEQLEEEKESSKSVFSDIMGYDVEKVLKIGGLIYIVVSILLVIVQVISDVILRKFDNYYYFLNIISRLLSGFLTGMLFYGVGQIVSIFKKREKS